MSILLNQLRSLPLNAASGIVRLHDRYYVVSDNETGLFAFDRAWAAEPLFIPLFPAITTDDPKERKKQKPDLEAILAIESQRSILTLPSGSTENRMTGAYLNLDGRRDIAMIDCRPLYEKLLNEFPELNIEGALAIGPYLRLLQRGNGSAGQNAVIDLDLAGTLESLQKTQSLRPECLHRIRPTKLGDLHGKPLAFTDAAEGLNGETWFLAVAESTLSTYDDGTFNGAVIGRMTIEADIVDCEELPIQAKPEGLCLTEKDGTFLIVTDADDPSRPSLLFEGFWTHGT